MTSNPPIRSIPIQADTSPYHYIKRYISSIQPHLQTFAQHGKRFLDKVLERETSHFGRDGRSVNNPSEINTGRSGTMRARDEIIDEHPRRTYHIAGPQVAEGKETYHPYRGSHPTVPHQPPIRDNQKNQYSKTYMDDRQQRPHPPKVLLAGQSNPPLATSRRQPVLEAEVQQMSRRRDEDTESAQRRLARKLSRREKAAIMKPKSPPPPPPPQVRALKPDRKRNLSTSQLEAKPSAPSDLMNEDEEHRNKKRRILPASQLASKYQPRNIYTSNERFTTAPPQKKMGFLSWGKASKPLHLQPETKVRRRVPVEPFNENRFLQLDQDQEMVSAYEEAPPEVIQQRKPEPLFYESSSRFDEMSNLDSQRRAYQPHQPPPRYRSAQHVPAVSQQSYRPNSRLPPPGITNSPSYPSGSSGISRRNRAFRAPSSVRTLSQVDREARELSRKREDKQIEARRREELEWLERQRQESDMRALQVRQERERAEYERVRLEEMERMRYEQAQREAQERSQQEREWQEARMREHAERERMEYEASQRDLRDITEVKRWKLRRNHLLAATPGPQVQQDEGNRHHQPSVPPQPPDHRSATSFGLRDADPHHETRESFSQQHFGPHLHHPETNVVFADSILPHVIPSRSTTARPTTAQPSINTQIASTQQVIPQTPSRPHFDTHPRPQPLERPRGNMSPPPVPIRAITQAPPIVPPTFEQTQTEVVRSCRTQHRLPPPTPQSHAFGRPLPPRAPMQPDFKHIGVRDKNFGQKVETTSSSGYKGVGNNNERKWGGLDPSVHTNPLPSQPHSQTRPQQQSFSTSQLQQNRILRSLPRRSSTTQSKIPGIGECDSQNFWADGVSS